VLYVPHSPSTVTEDPIVLFQRIAGSNRDALETLYRQMATGLLRYLRSVVRDTGTAEDILHDVFVHIWNNRTSLHVRNSARAFLYTMARNRALNRLKRDSRRSTTDFSEWYAPGFEARPNTGEDVSELETHLSRWIADLPPRRAEAFMLSRYHDLSHAEIARIMNLSERTVNTHVRHALQDLRERLRTFQTS